METTQKKSKLDTTSDEEIVQKSSCSLWSILITLVIIFIILFVWILRIKTSDKKTNTVSENSAPLIANVDSDVIESTVLGEEITLRITSSQLDTAVKSIKDFPLKNPTVKIDSSKVLISGKTSNSIFGVSVDVSVLPKVVDEKVMYEILEIKASGVSAPKAISDKINQNLSNSMTGILPVDSRVNVTEIKLFDGYLDVVGQRK